MKVIKLTWFEAQDMAALIRAATACKDLQEIPGKWVIHHGMSCLEWDSEGVTLKIKDFYIGKGRKGWVEKA